MTYSIESSPVGRIVVPDGVPPPVRLFYTTVDFPGRLTDPGVASLREAVRGQLGEEASLATANQVHGPAVKQADETSSGWREEDSCDALWTRHPNVALGIKVADCLPVTIVDPSHAVLANIHAGWRGSAAGIVRRCVEEIVSSTSFAPSDATAFLGPSIRVCCFEVGEEVAEKFDDLFPEVPGVVVRDSRPLPHLDLPRLTSAILRSLGIGSLHDTGLCTRCDDSIFHSFRRDAAQSGRNLALVVQC